ASVAFPATLNTVGVLRDGRVVGAGGSDQSALRARRGILRAKWWNPATETWTTMASMSVLRLYHSTALLLPDATVLVAGGGRISPAIDYPNAQIYSPPYLFKGPRPIISSAPPTTTYGSAT